MRLDILVYTNIYFVELNEKTKLYNQQTQTEMHNTSGRLEPFVTKRTTTQLLLAT